MPSDRARQLWNSGIPLNRAWVEFAPEDLRSQFEETPGIWQSLDAVTKTRIRKGSVSALSGAAQSFHRRCQLEIEMKEHLLTELFNQQLLATAYRIFPSRSQAPVLIRANYFEFDDPTWSADTFHFEDITYSRVRITKSTILKPVAKLPGGSGAAIDEAIDRLISENPGFCELPRKAACEQIRTLIGEKPRSGNGLSDPHLSKAIVRKCGKRRIRCI